MVREESNRRGVKCEALFNKQPSRKVIKQEFTYYCRQSTKPLMMDLSQFLHWELSIWFRGSNIPITAFWPWSMNFTPFLQAKCNHFIPIVPKKFNLVQHQLKIPKHKSSSQTQGKFLPVMSLWSQKQVIYFWSRTLLSIVSKHSFSRR